MNFSRREALAAIGTAGILAGARTAVAQLPRTRVAAKDRIRHGKIRQSVMGWCFKPMPGLTLAKHCREIGLVAIEGISPKDYKAVKKLGLKVSLVSSHSFKKGPINRDHHGYCTQRLRERIDLAVEVGCPNVITFTGMREPGINDKQAAKNCIDCWKSVIGYAEKKKINLCLEHLNSRDATHPMKGHPGYFGDDVDDCVELIRRVGSPNMKLLLISITCRL